MVGNADHLMWIATSEIEEATEPDDGDRSTTNFRVGPVAGCTLTPTEPGRRGLCEGACFVFVFAALWNLPRRSATRSDPSYGVALFYEGPCAMVPRSSARLGLLTPERQTI